MVPAAGYVRDLGHQVHFAGRPDVGPQLAHVGTQRVAQLFLQGNRRARQLEVQFRALSPCVEIAASGDAARIVDALQRVELPLVVEHVEPAADVVHWIGKLVAAHRAAVENRRQLLVDEVSRMLTPQLDLEAACALGVE